MVVRGKFRVSAVTNYESPAGAKQVSMYPVFKTKYGPNGEYISGNACEENAIFGEATPSGSIQMMIMNPVAAAEFVEGKVFYVDFTETPE